MRSRITSKQAAHAVEEQSEIASPEQSSCRPNFAESATLLTSELGGLTVGYGSGPPKRSTR
ncbi:hypothetical protein F2Q69_00059187 [Brassica cretica]|uniref:Uncharacterized protein n=2 Tax=Brassica cretica TaxID=69181 RepID=A0ABQ7AA41_BRACR|nr:hypothetical protein DY000_02053249 [Brassica cretica]KAF3573366.1 hypothetical protein F2Q69_00059187 [Brassica cretica]